MYVRHLLTSLKHAYVTQGLFSHEFGVHGRRENVAIATKHTPSLAGRLSALAQSQVEIGHPFEPDSVQPLAQPWCEGSRMTHAFVSWPYFMDLRRMTMQVGGFGAVKLIWIMGIHAGEAEIIERDGPRAFEERFANSEHNPADAFRDSVVR